MTPDHFRPYADQTGARARGCYCCEHFHGQWYASHLVCERDGGRRVVAVPIEGCAFWMRAIGADDDIPTAAARRIPCR